jgi:small subunit ribosomal protein S1
MKAVAEEEEANVEVFDYKESGSASTDLSALLKGLKF